MYQTNPEELMDALRALSACIEQMRSNELEAFVHDANLTDNDFTQVLQIQCVLGEMAFYHQR